MKSWWTLILVMLFCWSYRGHGAVICRDINDCQPTLIRTPKILVPKPSYRVTCTKTPVAQQYTPIKNACTCVNIQVTPASVQRVECDLTATTPVPECNNGGTDPTPSNIGEQGGAFFPANACGINVGSGTSPSATVPAPEQDDIDEPAVTTDPCTCAGLPPAAVDPVSLMLAQAEANRCRSTVHEDSLSFGPVIVPKDAQPPPPAVPDVNEEGLYAIEKPVVQLKTCKRFGQQQNSNGLASDTDALLALEDAQANEEADATAAPAVSLPSFADVGYQTEVPSCAALMATNEPLPPAMGLKPKIIYDATVTDSAECPGGKMCSCGKCSGGKCSCSCKTCSLC